MARAMAGREEGGQIGVAQGRAMARAGQEQAGRGRDGAGRWRCGGGGRRGPVAPSGLGTLPTACAADPHPIARNPQPSPPLLPEGFRSCACSGSWRARTSAPACAESAQQSSAGGGGRGRGGSSRRGGGMKGSPCGTDFLCVSQPLPLRYSPPFPPPPSSPPFPSLTLPPSPLHLPLSHTCCCAVKSVSTETWWAPGGT